MGEVIYSPRESGISEVIVRGVFEFFRWIRKIWVFEAFNDDWKDIVEELELWKCLFTKIWF